MHSRHSRTRWTTIAAVVAFAASPLPGSAQVRKPRIVIVATGGTIAGTAESATAAGYKSAAVPVDLLIAAVPQMKSFADVRGVQVRRLAART